MRLAEYLFYNPHVLVRIFSLIGAIHVVTLETKGHTNLQRSRYNLLAKRISEKHLIKVFFPVTACQLSSGLPTRWVQMSVNSALTWRLLWQHKHPIASPSLFHKGHNLCSGNSPKPEIMRDLYTAIC